MILGFHLFYLGTRKIVTKLRTIFKKRKLNDIEWVICNASKSSSLYMDRIHTDSYIDSTGNIKFTPCAYVQRYNAVSAVLRGKENIFKVVDFGCAELKFFRYLKHLNGIREILEVDIDEELLKRYAFWAAPLHSDYLGFDGSRSHPLEVKVLCGSVIDYDDCLQDTDAVVAIELIEHLYPDVLQKLPYNIFKLIHPRLAIFTTPNVEFNKLFKNSTGFRHDDHKFEWTRDEFSGWALRITEEFPHYKVQFYGIGAGPEGTEDLGCCSQMAVFERIEDCCKRERPLDCEIKSYKVVESYSYPHYVDTRTDEDKLMSSVNTYLSRLRLQQDLYYDYTDFQYYVPLVKIFDMVETNCLSFTQLREVLRNNQVEMVDKDSETFVVLKDDWSRSTSEEDWWAEDEGEAAAPHTTTDLQLATCDWDEEAQQPDSSHCLATSPNETLPKFTSWSQRNSFEMDQKRTSHVKRRPHSSFIRKSPRKMSKSFSLDSCLENINCEPVEVQATYLNLISNGRRVSSKILADSSSPVIDSSSCERAVDSGYPYSYTDLTPEQVDELATENEMTSARTSSTEESLSEEDDEQEVARRQEPRDLFIEGGVVENGDVANNNRDGEGNNVEGMLRLPPEPPPLLPDANDNNLVGLLLFPQQEELFPPWLLNMVDLVHAPLLEPLNGLADDSSSELEELDEPESKSV